MVQVKTMGMKEEEDLEVKIGEEVEVRDITMLIPNSEIVMMSLQEIDLVQMEKWALEEEVLQEEEGEEEETSE